VEAKPFATCGEWVGQCWFTLYVKGWGEDFLPIYYLSASGNLPNVDSYVFRGLYRKLARNLKETVYLSNTGGDRLKFRLFFYSVIKKLLKMKFQNLNDTWYVLKITNTLLNSVLYEACQSYLYWMKMLLSCKTLFVLSAEKFTIIANRKCQAHATIYSSPLCLDDRLNMTYKQGKQHLLWSQ
jgi:hypothetical protein